MTLAATVAVVTSAVEGDLDDAVVSRLITEAGGLPGPVHGRAGRPSLLANLDGYNRAARYSPWLVLVDLDLDDCAPLLVREALPVPSSLMSFRVAVREVESWLLADRERIAAFLGVPVAVVPVEPDSLLQPKETMVNLARRSSRSWIRSDLVPRPGSGRSTGPLYNATMIAFVSDGMTGWRPDVAVGTSPSLQKTRNALEKLIESL